MKAILSAAVFTALAVATPLSAQGRVAGAIPPGQMPRAGMCRVWIDGVPPGRQPAQTDCGTARTQAARTGGRVIYGGSTNRQDCVNQTGSVGSIILPGRGSGNVDCDYNRTTNGSVNGVWRSVGQNRNGVAIYERRTRDRNGNIIIQRATRDRNGNLSIFSTRRLDNSSVNSNRRRDDHNERFDRHRGDDDDDRRFDRRGRDDDDDRRFDRRGRDDDDDRFDRRNDDRDERFASSEHGDHKRGKGKKDRD